MTEIDKTKFLYKDLRFDEAVSHLIHSRMFEILGYLSLIKEYKIILPDNEQIYFNRVEELSKNLINELTDVIEYFKNSNKNN